MSDILSLTPATRKRRCQAPMVNWARRKGMELRVAEKWLAPYLNYEPATPS